MITIPDSNRLRFRLMNEEDVHALWELDQDPEVMRFINRGKPNTLENITDVFIPRMMSYRSPVKGWGIWQVIDKKSQVYLGWVLVRPMDFFTENASIDDIELGWRFFKNTWGKGYASEAALAVKQVIASQPEVKFFSALALEDNIGSVGVMKNIGMKLIDKTMHKAPQGDFVAVRYQVSVA